MSVYEEVEQAWLDGEISHTDTHRHINQQEHTTMSDYMENHRDRRIDAAAKAIAHVMGCPRSWADFRAEARAALNAADKVTEEQP